jgi:hypothetical protein
MQVLLYLYKDVLQGMPFFASKSVGFLVEVVQILTVQFIPPQEFVVVEVRVSLVVLLTFLVDWTCLCIHVEARPIPCKACMLHRPIMNCDAFDRTSAGCAG